MPLDSVLACRGLLSTALRYVFLDAQELLKTPVPAQPALRSPLFPAAVLHGQYQPCSDATWIYWDCSGMAAQNSVAGSVPEVRLDQRIHLNSVSR